jgi:uncharacterized membrane protein (UPF0127 family)
MTLLTVTNQTRNALLADRCGLAKSFWARGRGLLGRDGLAQGEGLVIYPEWSVHSFFMRFPIDVVFVDRADRVLGVCAAMAPNRPYAGAWGARYVIELPAGVLAATGTAVGDQLVVTPSPHGS